MLNQTYHYYTVAVEAGIKMLKRQPRKTIKVSEVAKQFGLSRDTVKRIAKSNGLQMIRYTDGPTSPVFLFEQQVNDLFAKKQER